MKIDKTFEIKFKNDDFGYLDAFGLDEVHKFSPFKDIELPDNPPEVTFVIGESGSGKTQLCKILAEKWNFITPILPKDDCICCEFLGADKESVDKCIYYLNYVGLSDARLYYTNFKYLSDSQKFRATIANTLLHNNGNGIFIDEFLSTLDRDTAKSIAYLIQKVARNQKVKLLLATAHNDLTEYVNPDLLIKGEAFPERFSVSTYKSNSDEFFGGSDENPIKYDIKLCDKEEYAKSRLGELHYKGKYVGGTKEVFVAKLNDKNIGFLVSVIVGKVNENKRRIARVVVHPSYRGIGVGTELVKKCLEHLEKIGIKKVSAVSALGLFNPFFEKAGMKREDDYVVNPSDTFYKKLISNDFNTTLWFSKSYCIEACKNEKLRKVMAKFAKNAKRAINPGGSKPSEKVLKQMILDNNLHAGRFLWTLRPKVLAKYTKEF